MSDDSLKANERVLGTLSDFAPESELESLGDQVIGAIRIELGKAGLASEDQVEEVFQSSLLKMYCAGDKPTADFRLYFLAVSRNEAKRYMGPVIRAERWAKEWLPVLKGRRSLPKEPLENERPVVVKALARLPRRHRLILTWMYVEGLSADEVKERLERTYGRRLTAGAVRTAAHRARKALAGLRETLAGNERHRRG
jgi:DNA-directed RNA polymerase specialized sigma24 family protein